jgi:hypothetical protein
MTEMCSYGCGQDAVAQLKNGKWCCSPTYQSCPIHKKKNSAGLLKAYDEGRGKYNYNLLPEEIKLKMSHKGQVFMKIEEVFVDGKEWGSEHLRKYVHHYELLEYKCSNTKCGIVSWHDGDLVLELDHISGNRKDNRIENLRWLCPNCHSQTPTFRGYNKSLSGKKKVSDEELLTALKESRNIRHALQTVGLAAKGGNYERATKLLKKCPDGGIGRHKGGPESPSPLIGNS